LQAGMGQNQSIGGDFTLLAGGKVSPMPPNGGVRCYGVAQRQEVKIKCAPSPTRGSNPAKLCLNRVQAKKDLVCAKVGLKARRSVDIVGSGPSGKTGGLKKATGLTGRQTQTCQRMKGLPQDKRGRKVIAG